MIRLNQRRPLLHQLARAGFEFDWIQPARMVSKSCQGLKDEMHDAPAWCPFHAGQLPPSPTGTLVEFSLSNSISSPILFSGYCSAEFFGHTGKKGRIGGGDLRAETRSARTVVRDDVVEYFGLLAD